MIEGLEATEPKSKQRGSGSALNCFVMRFRLWGKYSVEQLGEWYVVRRHGLFQDKLVNLQIPHLLMSLDGEPYFNQALGRKDDAERIWKRLNGAKAYDA
jgi:hypothetical protein